MNLGWFKLVLKSAELVVKMGLQLDLNKEIKKIDDSLLDKEQISTIDVAFIYNLCVQYIKNKLGIDI